MNLTRTTLRMNKWLERRFWWWLVPLGAFGIWMGWMANG